MFGVYTYAERVERTPTLKPFSDYVGSIPETIEAEVFHLAYELKNLKSLTSRMAADFVFVNFRKTHRLYSSSLLLAESQLSCELHNIVQSHFHICNIPIQIQDVFKECKFEHISQELTLKKEFGQLSDPWSATELFYGRKLRINTLIDYYNPTHKKSRPLPCHLPFASLQHVQRLMLRYKQCLVKAKAFVEKMLYHQYAHPKNTTYAKKIGKMVSKLMKAIRCIELECQKYDLIVEYERLGLPTGHSTQTLCSDFSYEQIKDMLDGHPSKIQLSDIECD
tara:strand:+ start:1103 stop:1939 length:837 start_codon:yes stop_codon:yes gene_type:complete